MSEIKLYNDDCIEAMKNIKEHTIDLIVTEKSTTRLIQNRVMKYV